MTTPSRPMVVIAIDPGPETGGQLPAVEPIQFDGEDRAVGKAKELAGWSTRPQRSDPHKTRLSQTGQIGITRPRRNTK